MSITHINRKGVTYTLHLGQTAKGKPCYFFGRQTDGQLVNELPAGFRISESPNGVVSLVRDRPSLIHAEELAAVEAVMGSHPRSRRYQVVGKRNRMISFR